MRERLFRDNQNVKVIYVLVYCIEIPGLSFRFSLLFLSSFTHFCPRISIAFTFADAKNKTDEKNAKVHQNVTVRIIRKICNIF